MKLMTMKTVRRGAVALAFAGATVVGGGIASAQSDADYPPSPTVPSTEAPVVSPESPTTQTDTDDTGATLPQTGGPGTTQILLIAGAAVAAGVAVTGVAGRRRDENLNAA